MMKMSQLIQIASGEKLATVNMSKQIAKELISLKKSFPTLSVPMEDIKKIANGTLLATVGDNIRMANVLFDEISKKL